MSNFCAGTPLLARFDDTRAISVWIADGNIYGRLLFFNGTAQDNEFKFNQNDIDPIFPYLTVSSLTHGGVVVTWSSFQGISVGSSIHIQQSKPILSDEFSISKGIKKRMKRNICRNV